MFAKSRRRMLCSGRSNSKTRTRIRQRLSWIAHILSRMCNVPVLYCTVLYPLFYSFRIELVIYRVRIDKKKNKKDRRDKMQQRFRFRRLVLETTMATKDTLMHRATHHLLGAIPRLFFFIFVGAPDWPVGSSHTDTAQSQASTLPPVARSARSGRQIPLRASRIAGQETQRNVPKELAYARSTTRT